MKALDELRQHGGAFPGGLWNVLVEMDQRLSALEQHAPMLDSLKPEYEAHMAAQAEPEPEPEPAPAEAPVQSPADQQAPDTDAQGGQAS